MTAPSTLLAVEGLSKRFGGVDALTEVSFGINRGEIYGVIGANGAGKSTLLSLISGATRPTSGSIDNLASDLPA